MALSFELDPNLLVLSRDNYGILDMLSDVGGLTKVLAFGFNYLLYLLNYRYIDSFLASILFRTNDNEELKPSKYGNIKEWFLNACPKKCSQRNRRFR